MPGVSVLTKAKLPLGASSSQHGKVSALSWETTEFSQVVILLSSKISWSPADNLDPPCLFSCLPLACVSQAFISYKKNCAVCILSSLWAEKTDSEQTLPMLHIGVNAWCGFGHIYFPWDVLVRSYCAMYLKSLFSRQSFTTALNSYLPLYQFSIRQVLNQAWWEACRGLMELCHSALLGFFHARAFLGVANGISCLSVPWR